MICCLLLNSFHGIQLYYCNWRNYFQAGENWTRKQKRCMQLEIPIFFNMIYSLMFFSSVPHKPHCCEWQCSSSSWSSGRVLDSAILPHQMTKHVSSATKIQTLASHTRYAFGPVKEMCNSMPNIWERSTLGPITHVIVESLWRREGENCTEGVIEPF